MKKFIRLLSYILNDLTPAKLRYNTKKDNFHNLTLSHFFIDKGGVLCTVNSTLLAKLFLSEGGGGWRKTLNSIM